MDEFNTIQLKLIARALILLSCVLEGERSNHCLELAEIFKAEYRSRVKYGER